MMVFVTYCSVETTFFIWNSSSSSLQLYLANSPSLRFLLRSNFFHKALSYYMGDTWHPEIYSIIAHVSPIAAIISSLL